MILWCDGGHDPAENMRRDTALLEAAAAGAEPVLQALHASSPRASPWAARRIPGASSTSTGAAQPGSPGPCVPPEAAPSTTTRSGPTRWPPRLADPSWGGGLEAAYGKASGLLVASLTRLGVPATLTPGAARGGPRAALRPGRRSTVLRLDGAPRDRAGERQARGQRAAADGAGIVAAGKRAARPRPPEAGGLPRDPGLRAGARARRPRSGLGARRSVAGATAAARALGGRLAAGPARGHPPDRRRERAGLDGRRHPDTVPARLTPDPERSDTRVASRAPAPPGGQEDGPPACDPDGTGRGARRELRWPLRPAPSPCAPPCARRASPGGRFVIGVTNDARTFNPIMSNETNSSDGERPALHGADRVRQHRAEAVPGARPELGGEPRTGSPGRGTCGGARGSPTGIRSPRRTSSSASRWPTIRPCTSPSTICSRRTGRSCRSRPRTPTPS